MTISILDAGEYAEVLDLGDGTVVKAYLRKQHTNASIDHWPSHEAFIRALFSNEAAVYERLQGEAELQPFLPKYFGRCSPPILAGAPEDRYVSACGIRLEKLPGRATKFLRLPESMRKLVEPILWEIREPVQPGNLWDCSCFVPGTRASFAVVDFGLWDRHIDYTTILEEQGFFTDAQMQFLGTVGLANATDDVRLRD